jgi:glycosyltransferase involved in cell wall biosynthesis
MARFLGQQALKTGQLVREGQSAVGGPETQGRIAMAIEPGATSATQPAAQQPVGEHLLGHGSRLGTGPPATVGGAAHRHLSHPLTPPVTPGPDLLWPVLAWGLLGLAAAACLGLAILLGGLVLVIRQAPRLRAEARTLPEGSLTVVVPAYNEETNIAACLASLLASAPPCPQWQVVLVDDGSSDATAAVARATARSARGDSSERFSLLEAGPRPQGERWVGKNWACSRAMDTINSDWVLFVDADVRLQPATLQRALGQAVDEGADLLSLAPRLCCGCLAEWMVQPIMASLLGLGFPINAANDPADPTAFAAGPFMLFRRTAYLAIGGHRALAGEVVEDLALARRIKAAGYRLRYLLGLDAAELRMYPDFAALWEGWSKNWFTGLDGSLAKALGAATVVVLLFSGPWLLAPAAAISLGLLGRQAAELAELRLPLLAALALAVLGIGLQLGLRLWTRRAFQLPLRHWWLMGAGGLVVGVLGPTSAWRTLSGRGWTWKGRSLR